MSTEGAPLRGVRVMVLGGEDIILDDLGDIVEAAGGVVVGVRHHAPDEALPTDVDYDVALVDVDRLDDDGSAPGPAGVPLVAVSGHAPRAQVPPGAVPCCKPFSPSEVVTALRVALPTPPRTDPLAWLARTVPGIALVL